MRKIFSVIAVSVLFVACGSKKGGTSKDAKVDFQLSVAALDSIDKLDDKATFDKYEGKLIEIKGIIKSGHKSVSSASPNAYSFYLCTSADQEDSDCTICYTDEDPTPNIGKSVTVKGKFDYAGTITIDDCIVY